MYSTSCMTIVVGPRRDGGGGGWGGGMATARNRSLEAVLSEVAVYDFALPVVCVRDELLLYLRIDSTWYCVPLWA